MGKIISFSNQKGGTGKTTLAANLAVLWSNSEYKVAVFDGDAQKSLTHWIEARKKYYGENDIGIDLHSYNPHTFEEDLNNVKKKYNFILIDSPPSITYETIQIVKNANRVIVPVQPSPVDLMATVPFLNMVKREKKKSIVNRKTIVHKRKVKRDEPARMKRARAAMANHKSSHKR